MSKYYNVKKHYLEENFGNHQKSDKHSNRDQHKKQTDSH